MLSSGPRAVSVAICTANRAAQLEETLTALHQVLDTGTCEILVIDNGSVDETPALLRSIAANYPHPLRAMREDRVGLSAARNRAVREAQGEILLFLDDDAIPRPGWIRPYLEAFREPTVLAAGGPVEPVFDGPLPEWLDERFLPYLSAWERGENVSRLKYNELPRGANMGFRRSGFAVFGDFLEQLGRRGSSLRSCEEIEYCVRLERGGAGILYLPDASVRHRVATRRLDAAWMSDRFSAQGFSEAIVDWRHAGARGLRTGLQRAGRNARRSGAEVMDRCLRSAARGYRLGSLYSFFCVARYQPIEPIALLPFQPFG